MFWLSRRIMTLWCPGPFLSVLKTLNMGRQWPWSTLVSSSSHPGKELKQTIENSKWSAHFSALNTLVDESYNSSYQCKYQKICVSFKMFKWMWFILNGPHIANSRSELENSNYVFAVYSQRVQMCVWNDDNESRHCQGVCLTERFQNSR